jgi:4-hydroxy-3-methylbut-2-enyl diphosphate reductase
LPHLPKIGIISQTTSNVQEIGQIIKEIKKHTNELKIHQTICDATRKRQEAALRLAEKVDLMIIVGGKNSSNTKRLYEICSKIILSYHIETSLELNTKWFKNKKTAGVTSGASTPEEVLDEIVNKLRLLD